MAMTGWQFLQALDVVAQSAVPFVFSARGARRKFTAFDLGSAGYQSLSLGLIPPRWQGRQKLTIPLEDSSRAEDLKSALTAYRQQRREDTTFIARAEHGILDGKFDDFAAVSYPVTDYKTCVRLIDRLILTFNGDDSPEFQFVLGTEIL